jgi:hypothetical protein
MDWDIGDGTGISSTVYNSDTAAKHVPIKLPLHGHPVFYVDGPMARRHSHVTHF